MYVALNKCKYTDPHECITLISNENTLVVFLPVCRTDDEVEVEGSGEQKKLTMYEFSSSISGPLERFVRLTAALVGVEQKMRVHHESMTVVARSPQNSELTGLVLKTGELIE